MVEVPTTLFIPLVLFAGYGVFSVLKDWFKW